MILVLGLISIASWLPLACSCCDAGSAETRTEHKQAFEMCHTLKVPSRTQQHPLERKGWGDPLVYGPDDVLPPTHLSTAELGPDTTGLVSRRGRNGRWQVEAWQVTTVSPLDLNPATHAHLNYRIPLPRRASSRLRRAAD